MKFIPVLLFALYLSGCTQNSPEKIFQNYDSGNKLYVYQYVETGGNVCIYNQERNITLLSLAIIEDDSRLYELIFLNPTYSIAYELANDFTFLHVAAHKNNLTVLERVLPDIVNVNIPEGTTFITPLVHTIIARHPEAMTLLLKHPTMSINYVNPKDKQKLSAAHIAAVRGYLEGIKLLSQYGADFSQRNALGQTPLEFAQQRLTAQRKNLSEEQVNDINDVIDFLTNH